MNPTASREQSGSRTGGGPPYALSPDSGALPRWAARESLRYWWIAPLVAGIAMLATWALTAAQARVFQATAAMVIVPAASVTDATDMARSLDVLERRTLIATLAQVAETRETRLDAGSRARLAPEALAELTVDARVIPSTNIIRVRTEGSDPTHAAALANAIAAVTAEKGSRMYPLFALEPLEAAVAANEPVRPNLRRNLSIATMLGLFAGAGLALAATLGRRMRAGPR